MTRFHRTTATPRTNVSALRAAVSALLLALLAAAAPASAGASDKAADKTPPAGQKPAAAPQDAAMEAMMRLATPGPEHAVLQPLAGTWKASIKSYMTPGDPMVSQGTLDRTWIMGGRYLVGKHTGDFMGMPFEGMEILGFDRQHGKYVSTWIDNMGTGIALAQDGTWDPATKSLSMTMSFDDPVTGRPTASRMVTKIVNDDTVLYTMTGQRDGKDYTQMEATYTRVK